MGDGARRRPLNKRQRPVVPVIRYPHQDFLTWDFCYRILQNLLDEVDGRHSPRRTVCIPPFVCHQNNMVHRGAVEGVVVSLVKQTALVCADFRGKGGGYRITQRVQAVDHPLHKPVVRLAVARIYVLKINVKPGVVFGLNSLHDIVEYGAHRLLAVEYRACEITVKAAPFKDIGYHHQGSYPLRPCRLDYHGVVQRHKASVCPHLIAERADEGQVRQSVPQGALRNAWERVPVDINIAELAVGHRNHNRLPRIYGRRVGDIGVGLKNLRHRGAVPAGNPKQRLPRRYGMPDLVHRNH